MSLRWLAGALGCTLAISLAPARAQDAPVCQTAPNGMVVVAPDPGIQTDSEATQVCAFTATGAYEYTSTILFAWSISVTRGGRTTVEAGCTPPFPGTCHVPTTGVLGTRARDRVTVTLGSNCLVQSIPHTPQQWGPCWIGSILMTP